MTIRIAETDNAAAVSGPRGYFTPDGDSLVPSQVARGPWGNHLSGHVLGGILGRTLERETADPDLQPSRLTVDLLRPAALQPVQVRTSVQRQGRRICLVDAAAIETGKKHLH